MASTRRISIIVGVAALAGLALPSAASAAVTCSFDSGTGALSVSVTNGTSVASVRAAPSPSDDIQVDDATDFSTPISCTNGPPTLSATSSIAVDESGSSQGTTARLDFANGRLSPGTGDTETGTAEIEVTYTADTSGNDQFFVQAATASADQSFRFGAVSLSETDGNLNGDDDADDVKLTGVDTLTVNPGTGNDTMTADGSGSGAFTGPSPLNFHAFASNGNDTEAAGSGGSHLEQGGGAGNDTATGGSGADNFEGGSGNDTYDGGGGSNDFFSYESEPSATGVTFDLGLTTPQNTGDLGTDQAINAEHLVGSNGSDHLTGSGGSNIIFGGNSTQDAGNDVLDGAGGGDQLIGWSGNDTLIGGQGNDSLEGDSGTDTASYAVGSTGPVTMDLDLAKTGVAQATGGAGTDTLVDGTQSGDPDSNHEVENLTGSPFGDTLTGNDLANVVDAYDGVSDAVDCVATGDGDTAILDEVGVDSVANCETFDNAPQTSIDSGPADGAAVATRTPTYNLIASEPSTFQVKVDSGTFQACLASCQVPSLSDGAHTLSFRAVDEDENMHADLTPASRSVTVDATAPQTTITSGPSGVTSDNTPTFAFNSSELPATFRCSLDGAPFTSCTSPRTTAPLADGSHVFRVKAADALLNEDASAASRSFVVDTSPPPQPASSDLTPPETTLTAHPKKKSRKRKARFEFASSEAGSSFLCSVDGKGYAPCASPFVKKKLKPGKKHRFDVVAVDPAGNQDQTPASFRWRVLKKK